MAYKIIVAGIGPGHPDYVLPAARQAIGAASVLVGGRRALADFARPGQQTFPITGDIPGVLGVIRKKLEHSDVVVIVSGDPGYYSLLDALRREFAPELLAVIPGISSVQFAFSRLALPWHGARLLSLHGRRPQAAELRYEKDALLGILTDAVYTSHSVPLLLQAHGWPPAAQLFICARLSYEDEVICATTLGEAAAEREYTHCVLVVKA